MLRSVAIRQSPVTVRARTHTVMPANRVLVKKLISHYQTKTPVYLPSQTLKLPSLSPPTPHRPHPPPPRPITLSQYALLPRLRVDHVCRRLRMSNIFFKRRRGCKPYVFHASKS